RRACRGTSIAPPPPRLANPRRSSRSGGGRGGAGSAPCALPDRRLRVHEARRRAFQQRVAAEALLRMREVGPVMAAPALLAEPRADRHRPRDVEQVAVLDRRPVPRPRVGLPPAALEPAPELLEAGAVPL